jgi:hypothetical protein
MRSTIHVDVLTLGTSDNALLSGKMLGPFFYI